ncbi:MAG: hypothetical protein JST12_13940 [Armatimonadetes bacterium]|nr:hypothetical protein [Armatimonadota bacterium]MBS1702760.1 hypothetical protein [Armatimonadota bacterium]MBS1727570.1 hypothetical protein [Armatimonadota bacterium]
MNKKTGVVLAIVAGILILCCAGGAFMIRSMFNQIQETVKTDKEFVKTALTATAKNWDEKDFALYADDSFNKPENKEKTQKLFTELKDKLGSIKTLGDITVLRRGGFRTNDSGTDRGFYITFRASATFEKRDGVFDVTVKNNKDKHVIYSIALNPDAATADSIEAGNNVPAQ